MPTTPHYRSYFVAGAVVAFLVVVLASVVFFVVVLVPVVFLSEELQPANVKATSTRTADSVRTIFLMMIPFHLPYRIYTWPMFDRNGTVDAHQATIIGLEREPVRGL